MKNIFTLLAALILLLPGRAKAQLEKVFVETFYISDSLDNTDSTDGRVIAIGSKTYRVYVDLVKGSKITKIYGCPTHLMKIQSTDTIYNNIDRPSFYFGYLENKLYFGGNPTLFLDSWITLGKATTLHYGVPKTQDTSGTIRTNNWGGYSSVTGGILRNNDPAAGIPLTAEDGLIAYNPTLGQWLDNGFRDMSNTDTTVFGPVNKGLSFVSNTAFLKQVSGVGGAFPDSNQVLVAQITTKGNLSFELNVEVIDSAGNNINYVAQSVTAATGDTVVAPSLKYPPVCGCKDSKYLEYNPNFGCNDQSQCITLKVFGCTDSMACNYDPGANVLLPNFCCYPGYCNDRDIALVCPGLHPRMMQMALQTNVYPNPVDNYFTLQMISASSDYKNVTYTIYDAFDRAVVQKDLGFVPANTFLYIDAAELTKGFYLLKVDADGVSNTKKFIKN